jgi:hypothetical protein
VNALSLPTVVDARLPAVYEQACTALATCERVDECKDWADKAAALASYAKQAEDETLQRLAMRIQARAVRRCGELLQDFDARGDHRRKEGDRLSSQREVADAAGMSEHQQKQAVRVANVPTQEFERLIDSNDPPTVTALAEQGTATRPKVVSPFTHATHVLGVLEEFARFCAEHDAGLVATGILPHEAAAIRRHAAMIDPWVQHLLANLSEVAC